MYAVFQLSGVQFTGQVGDILEVPKQKSADGEKISISDVLLLKDKDSTIVGTPFVEGAVVEAEMLENSLADKVLIYKYKRRTKYRRTQGHRQMVSKVKIVRIDKSN